MIDYTRRQKNQVEIDQLNQMKVGENMNEFDLKAQLNRALSRIPEIQRSVILLRDYEGYNYAEIGEITGLSESQVKVYIYRARLALRKLIGSPEVLI